MSLRVEILERLRFLVSSEDGGMRTHQAQYLVDLSARGGNGQCDCPHFRCRIAPVIAEGGTFRCKHIQAAREFLTDAIIADLSKRDKEEDEKNLASGSPYAVARTKFLMENHRCRACNRIPAGARPPRVSCDVHHSRGRLGSLLMDARFWIPVCRICHNWIHANPAAAREAGLLGPWHKTEL